MPYGVCLNNEDHYGRLCDECEACDRCCMCADGNAGVCVTGPDACLAAVMRVENKARKQYDGAMVDSGGTWAAGTYRYSIIMPDGKMRKIERWINSAAEEAELFDRWAAKGITAKRGRYVGR